MARRRRAADALIGSLVLFGITVWLIKIFYKSLSSVLPAGMSLPAVITVSVTVASAFIAIQQYYQRRRTRRLDSARREAVRQRGVALLDKYRDPIVANEIIAGGIWRDMTKEQLLDAWGHPAYVETKVMKTKVLETYKFGRVGANRFRRRVTLENDIVVGWEQQ
jgi:hypothetical protein